MVYSNKFVMTVLRQGQVQKELANGTVQIPFGEYALRFRNKNNRRAVVQFSIDGENVSGPGYIVPANGHIDIERHHDTPTNFNFVSLDSEEATDFGKNGPNPDKVKGAIEARFYLEKERVYQSPVKEIHHHHYPYPTWSNHMSFSVDANINTTQPTRSLDINSNTMLPIMSFNACGLRGQALRGSSRQIQEGCTVEGSRSNQTFSTQFIDYDKENYVTLRVFLEGFYLDEDETIEVPKVAKKSKIKKKLSQLEEENERLRRLLAEKENRELKEKLGIVD